MLHQGRISLHQSPIAQIRSELAFMLKRNRPLPQVGEKSAKNPQNSFNKDICINCTISTASTDANIIAGSINQDGGFITQKEHCVFLDT
jgi:hypothetical protein